MLKKINKYHLLEYICIYIITLTFTLICNTLTEDEIWNYGFAYNIASGLIPYKDFNMVITPFYPMLAGIIMHFFCKSIVMFHIFNTII